MNKDDIVRLLQAIAAYDSRKLDRLTVAAWMEAATRARWSFPAALEAVHQHYATSTAWLMPGHVTEAIRASRRHPAPVGEVLAELTSAKPASDEQRAAFMAEIRKLADSKAVK